MTTIVTFLLDRSGSMGSIKDATIEAFNAYLDELKKGEDITLSLLQFDTVALDTTFKNKPIAEVTGLNSENFLPRGGTPLIDASVKTIKAVEKSVAEKPGSKVVICFQTDGEENSSREHTWAELQDLIKEKTALGWEFNFLGAGIDAYKQASAMGLGAAQTMSYDSTDRARTRAAFSARGAATMMFASGARADMSYTSDEKRAAGDRFAKDLDLGGADLSKPLPKVAKKAIVDAPDL